MPLLFGLGALLLGQDASWDLRDYHYYNPYAFLNNRMSFDVAPAQLQTYYNPMLYIPFYFMVNYLPPPAVGLLLGTVQGINFYSPVCNRAEIDRRGPGEILVMLFGCLVRHAWCR
jgi:hypothetical protein